MLPSAKTHVCTVPTASQHPLLKTTKLPIWWFVDREFNPSEAKLFCNGQVTQLDIAKFAYITP